MQTEKWHSRRSRVEWKNENYLKLFEGVHKSNENTRSE